MMKYFLKRLLLFIPTLFVISLLAFIISVKAPGDPVEILSGSVSSQGAQTGSQVSKAQKDSIRVRLGLDKPLFYFSLSTASEPDTLYRIKDKKHREVLSRLNYRYGDWQKVSDWYLNIASALDWWSMVSPEGLLGLDSTNNSKENRLNAWNEGNHLLLSMMHTHEENNVRSRLDSIKVISSNYIVEGFEEKYEALEASWRSLIQSSPGMDSWLPSLHWYGFDNQYHHWIKRLLLYGDFGYSYVDKEPVSEKIWSKFFISFKLIFLSVLIAYLISIPIGVRAARKKGKLLERVGSVVLFMLYSLPNFFVGMMLLYLFANPDFLVWFPESGYMDPNNYDPEWPFWKRWSAEAPYMVLPLITYTYSSFAFISRILRAGMLDNLDQDFIRTARAKGMPEKTVFWRHALRNSLLPVITIFVNIFPMAIGGSVIIETIFTYPGMGLASYEAIHNYDYPSIVAIFTLSGFLTMVGYLVADILYVIADPRITYTGK